ncbi:MAG TPA: pimeloyl-[acyl-carrier protein] methyl ester esterase [Thiothrix sp.]|nr:pimeloyl-[acyl-carrier protein] methyl ester esterase [Thiothrix sp.]
MLYLQTLLVHPPKKQNQQDQCETRPVLVALHGWGMNHHVWQPIKPLLEQYFAVYWVDLPGHGENHSIPLQDLRTAANQLAAVLPDQAMIMGWSLGGLMAQYYAFAHRHKVAHLCLVASSPCFVQKTGWQPAMSAQTLTQFEDDLAKDYQGTLQRFLALQFLGVKEVGLTSRLRQLREKLLATPPDPASLKQGLHLLNTLDLRALPVLQPRDWLFGALDRLIPRTITEHLPDDARNHYTIIPRAGHAPFISHPEYFVEQLVQRLIPTTKTTNDHG